MENDIFDMKLHEVRDIALSQADYPNSPLVKVIRVPGYWIYLFPEGIVRIPFYEKVESRKKPFGDMKRYEFEQEIDGSSIEEDPQGKWVKWEDIVSLEKDAMRHRWLRKKYVMGSETYLAEFICTKNQLDEYIDNFSKQDE